MVAKTAKTQALKFKRAINAPPAEVYAAFTNSTALREWFCDTAQADARKGGRFYMSWNAGHSVSGEYTALTPDKKVAFLWGGPREPGTMRVTVSLTAKNQGTVVTVTHAEVGFGKAWARTLRGITGGWEGGLENLQSVLETGHDLRFTLRPMLGISVGEFNEKEAAKLGVPVKEGLRLDSTLEGMGAYAAGLRAGDVLVSLGGKKLTGWSSLPPALQGRRAGDKVPVVFYRGKNKQTVTMELSRRPMPDIPATAPALAEAVRKIYDPLDAELADCFQGVSEEEASYRPGPEEWSAKESVSHILIGERDTQSWIAEIAVGEERWFDGQIGNSLARTRATLAAFPTVPALLEELKRSEVETTALLTMLPAEFVARKRSYWRVAYNMLNGATHTRDHMGQIRAAIAAARKK